jgi:endoglycosylceramidase
VRVRAALLPTTASGAPGGQGLVRDDSDLSSIKVEKLKILERTYPQATAGISLELTFDPDASTFLYRYEPRATGAAQVQVRIRRSGS